jgi:hypothetical protein
MSHRSKLVIAGALVLLAVACGAWAWFLSGKTLDDADKWSSVMAGFTGVILGASGLIIGVLALRQPAGTDQQASPPGPGSRNIEVGQDNHGVIITGDNNNVGQQSSVSTYHVNLQDAKGVQVGDDNTQINHW